ncbi:acetate--CoA ligase [Sediminibacterium sp.]|uniref:acetate--CoA ligase n=1 Tax=Sediminibacterium sp. TaxID=1917865 RepID=UPI002734A145|nr:acetate--CoA ligase [Sediminibacterium sp.]MDP3567580.1 acetate--CoA ligase [Sediminibacterium sp.]
MIISTFEEYNATYKKSVDKPEDFWSEIASEFYWQKKWDKVLDWNFDEPNIKWFINGKFNITENAIDRHLPEKANKTAFIWEANSIDANHRVITYQNLHDEVCKVANTLKSFGIKKGDRVCIYMPMIPETIFAMLACARIGAIHSVVFAGFSSSALAGRIQDSDCKIVLTTDGACRGAKNIPIKAVVDEALETCPCVEKVLIYKHTNMLITINKAKDIIWQDVVPSALSTCEAELMDSEDVLFILYTSGSTGKPKGVVHTCGGYMVYTCYTFKNVFQINTGTDSKDLFWCTADVGWITGHSYITYGTLLAGASSVIFEGVPTFPDAGRFWKVVDKHKVTHFYTAPTAIRALEACGLDFVTPYKLDSLKVLGCVGEPINEEAWHWYNNNIGKGKCPLVDTWWQTETGGILISALAGVTPTKPSFATLPLPGIQPLLVDDKGNELFGNNVEGNLCIKFPWPSIIRTTYGDHNRCKEAYFSTYKGLYFTGDGCRRDENGFYRITGRVDDVMNVSGHRIGTAEVESAINMHADVVESAVVAYPHDIKGQGIYAYVIVPSNTKNHDNLRKEILAEVTKIIGPIAKPDKIQVVSGLPKTRSGKIMRRILRKVAEGELTSLGDTSTLLDPLVVDEIIKGRL